MIYIVENAAAIGAATAAGLAVGAGFLLAGGRRAAITPGLIATAAIAEFWLCAILAGALILAPPKAEAWTMAFGTAVIIWIGFIVPALAVSYRARALPIGTMLSDAAHWLAVMLVHVVVLRTVGLVAPTP